MLKRFVANNFRSLLNVEFRPSGLNLLVGPNNAGKTNLCSALRFVARSSESTLDAALLGIIGERWNVTNFFTPEARNLDFQIDCSLPFNGDDVRFSYSLRLQTVRADLRSESVGAESVLT